jgi:hypothetical protein
MRVRSTRAPQKPADNWLEFNVILSREIASSALADKYLRRKTVVFWQKSSKNSVFRAAGSGQTTQR